ncbi:MAG: undecaprenyl-diphosphate phosphatase [Bacteroidia bacterium]|nr:undecaprenyl-diphosphate phosphatase [Bacteroidia bacterium]
MNYLQAFVMAVVEGITEFLPISSTGHMIIAQKVLGIENSEFVRTFIVNIQFGAILSVIVLYWKRFFQSFTFYFKLAVACLPLVIAWLLSKYIDKMLGNVIIVAVSMLIGGIILLFVDKWFFNNHLTEKGLSYPKAFIIGLFQIISVIPGVSRSAATIIGGMSQKLDRKSAAEFSFILAVPTMFAATLLKLHENYKFINTGNAGMLIFGNIVAFIVAILAIKSFVNFLTIHGFKIFGYYRIMVGLIILVLLLSGNRLFI